MKGKEYLESLRDMCSDSMQMSRLENLPKERYKDIDYEKIKLISSNMCEQDKFYNQLGKILLSNLSHEVEEKLKDVYIGVLPTYRINACTMADKNLDMPVIVINTQLMAAISQYCEAQLIFGKKSIKNEDEAVEWFKREIAKIVDCFIYSQYAIKLELLPNILEKEELELLASYTLIQELFIIAHEYAHIYLGHLSIGSIEKTCIADSESKDKSINIYNYDLKKELDADLLALKWIVEATEKSKEWPFNLFEDAIYLIIESFQLFHVVDVTLGKWDCYFNKEEDMEKVIYERLKEIGEEVERMITGKTKYNNTHPKTAERICFLVMKAIELNQINEEQKVGLLMTLFNSMFFETYDLREYIVKL